MIGATERQLPNIEDRVGVAQSLELLLSYSHALRCLRQMDTVPALPGSAAAASALLETAVSAALSRGVGLSAQSASAS